MAGGENPVTAAAAKPPARASLHGLVLRGVAWKAASRVLLQLSRFVVAIILARLLTPEEFGLAAMVLVISGLVVVVGDAGLGMALVQRRRLKPRDRSTVFWTSAAIGLAFTLLGIAVSGPVARFYDEPDVKPLFMVLSLSFLVTALGTTQNALLVRAMNFRSLELRQLGGTLAGAVVGIAAAAAGYGAWAIVAQQLSTAVVSTLLLWCLSDWHPGFRFSFGRLREIGSFTSNVFGQNLLYFAGRNVDNLLVGRYLGPAALGTYALAYNVMLAPFHHIGGVAQQVLYPAFARLQDDVPKLADIWIRATRLVGALTIPALVGLVVVVPDFVAVVLGEQWSSATPVIRILAWVGLVQSVQTMNGDVLLALGRARTIFRYTVVWFVAGVVSFVAGLPWGVVGVAAAYAIASTVIEPFNAWLTARALGISIWRFARGLIPVVQASLVMALAVFGVRALLVAGDVPPVIRLVIAIVVGACVYGSCLAWRSPATIAEVRDIWRRRRAAAGDVPQSAASA
jgi:O-antigen/teichoic acid export membrane protein